MDSTYYFDTRSLRDHVSDLQEERKVIQCLYDTVIRARDTGDPLIWNEYGSVLNDIKKLQSYFDKMIEVLDNISFDAEKLANELKSTIQDGTDQIHNQNNKIML